MILDIWSIHTEYLDKTNEKDEKCNKIFIYVLRLDQGLYISNEEKKQVVSFPQQQTIKVKYYEKMIDKLQSLAFANRINSYYLSKNILICVA